MAKKKASTHVEQHEAQELELACELLDPTGDWPRQVERLKNVVAARKLNRANAEPTGSDQRPHRTALNNLLRSRVHQNAIAQKFGMHPVSRSALLNEARKLSIQAQSLGRELKAYFQVAVMLRLLSPSDSNLLNHLAVVRDSSDLMEDLVVSLGALKSRSKLVPGKRARYLAFTPAAMFDYELTALWMECKHEVLPRKKPKLEKFFRHCYSASDGNTVSDLTRALQNARDFSRNYTPRQFWALIDEIKMIDRSRAYVRIKSERRD